MRYKVNFALDTVMSLWGIGLLIFAVIIDPTRLQDTIGSANYFVFMLIGIALQTCQEASTYGS
ncbi:MAG: hypothetical protein ACUVTL_02450 [Thermoproteota archaeon]